MVEYRRIDELSVGEYDVEADEEWFARLIQAEIANGATTDREIVLALVSHAPNLQPWRLAWFIATLRAARAALVERNARIC